MQRRDPERYERQPDQPVRDPNVRDLLRQTIATLSQRRPVPGPTLSAAEEHERRLALRRQAAGLAGKE